MKDLYHNILTRVAALAIMIFAGCQEFVEVNSPTYRMASETIFKDDETAKSAIVGIYVEMSQNANFNNANISLLTGLSSDEIITIIPDYLQFQENELRPDNEALRETLWQPGYRYVYMANSALEGLSNSGDMLTDEVRRQLEGEARFIRSFCLFHLLNLFGEIPLVAGTDLEKNAAIGKSPVEDVYKFIEEDLLSAKALLPADYSFALPAEYSSASEASERIRATTWAASALLARVYLYQQKWSEAQGECTRIIVDGKHLYGISKIEDVFLAGSSEAIWQLKPVIPGLGTWEANLYIPYGTVPNFAVSDQLLEAFEPGDARKIHWLSEIDNENGASYYFPHKYKQPSGQGEFHVEMRLSEIFLIRAEARTRINDLDGAKEDVNVIRSRAGISILTGLLTSEDVFKTIQQERRLELLNEGHRWFDLKRWRESTSVLKDINYKKWQGTDDLYPVPEAEIELNRNLKPQNLGY